MTARHDPGGKGSYRFEPECATCDGDGMIERLATPDEVDAGCELGIAYDPCPDCGVALEPARPVAGEKRSPIIRDRADWCDDRPATTLAGRDLAPDPGTNANRFNDATKSRNDGVRITIADALVLQS